MDTQDRDLSKAVEEALRTELERRLLATPQEGFGSRFSATDYVLMVLVGGVVPVSALIWGWL